jgi:uncharacterized protein (DUF58 family)
MTAAAGASPATSWRISAKVVAEATAAGLALLAAAATGDFPLVGFAAPLAIAAVIGLTRQRPASPGVAVAVEPLVTSPGEIVEISIVVKASSYQAIEIAVILPAGVEADGPHRWMLRQRPGDREELSCKVRALRPGRFALGRVVLSVSDPAGCLSGSDVAGTSVVVEARPERSVLKMLVRPERVRATAGDRVARLAGDGIEFADVREQPAGALGRRINWRATARRQVTCVNVQHPERSTDIVLLIDTFSESQIPAVISIAMNLADAYLKRHDRVGLIAFGGVLDWVEPGTGPSQVERIRRSLLSSEAYFSYALKTADVIPRRLFPAGCLVLAVSALGDGRFNGALASLRLRGIDLAVIEVAPPLEPEGLPATLAGSIAWRIISMEREDLRDRFWRLGVPIVAVPGPGGVATALAEIAAFRRSVRSRQAHPR